MHTFTELRRSKTTEGCRESGHTAALSHVLTSPTEITSLEESGNESLPAASYCMYVLCRAFCPLEISAIATNFRVVRE